MKPVLLFAFADDPTRPLDGLKAERFAIQEKLTSALEEELCEMYVIERAGIESILEAFHRYPDRIAVFHFAGHAGSYELCLQNADGNTEIAHAGGFAEFLALQRGMQLVFLNGCSTQAQVEELLRAGVGAVIATSQAINDEVAANFSGRFYRSLGAGDPIEQAYQEAAAAVKMKMGTDSHHRDLYYRQPVAQAERFPWDFYVGKGADIVREWNLPGAAGNPLFGLPKPPSRELPATPFRYLHWFHPEDAEIFFGRAYQIRELYDKIMAQQAPGIIHLYGRSGVGKSSLLAAGLLPRLQTDHEAAYVRRNQEKGLLYSLAAAVGVSDDPESLISHWRQRENSLGKPLTIILDQVEEAFTRPRTAAENGKGPSSAGKELEELLELLRQWNVSLHRPQGKLILSYRKEYLAEIENFFLQARIAYEKIFLDNLKRNDILAAVTGLTRSPRTRDRYGLQIEDGLPDVIADDLLEDRDSPIAPVLQILLSKMWDASPRENGRSSFITTTYQSLKKEGLLLGDFLHQKLDELKNWNRKAVESGLVLDLLLFHTTSKGTAARRTIAETEARYPHHARFLPQLITELKNRYLLVEVAAEDGDGHDVSLAHDTLAPLLLEMAQFSDLPAQKAHRILTNKIGDWTPGDVANALDEASLKVVEQGQWGLRTLTDEEKKLIDAGRERRKRARRRRQWVIVGGVIMLALIIGASVVARIQQGIAQANAEQAEKEAARANIQTLRATSNSLAATSFVDLSTNPTNSFRLAEYAMAYDSANPSAFSALLQAFYSRVYFFGKHWRSGAFFLDEPRNAKRPVYPKDLIIYEHKFGEDFSEHDFQAAKAKIGELLSERNSALFLEGDAQMLVNKAVYSPKKGFLLLVFTGGSDFALPLVEVWDIRDNQHRYDKEPLYEQYLTVSQGDPDFFSTASFSSDDRYVVIPRSDEIVVVNLTPELHVPESQISFTLSSSTAEVMQAFFSRDRHFVSAVDARGQTSTWNLDLNPIPSLKFSGQTDVMADTEGRFLVLAKGKQAEVWSPHAERLGAGLLSASRNALVEAPGGLTDIRLVELINRKWHGRSSHGDLLRDTSDDGRFIIAAERKDRHGIWGVQVARLMNSRGDTLLTLRGHSDMISSVDISPDSRYFLTATCPKGSRPQTKLWDAGGNEVLSLDGFGGKVGFLPGGNAFYTYLLQCCAECEYDDDIKIWSINPAHIIGKAEAAGAHHLSAAEMARYGIDPDFIKLPGQGAPDAGKKNADIPSQVRRGLISGANVNVRREPRITDNVVGKLNNGARVEILDEMIPEESGNTYVCLRPTLLKLDGGGEQPLGKGLAVLRLEDPEDSRLRRIEVDIDGVLRHGSVPAADIQPMKGESWFKVQSGNLNGWVYGSFINED
jgi:WD40 repeat protein